MVALAVPVFAAAVTVTLPAPVPPAGLTVTHAALLDDVHAQVDGLAPTVTPADPPAEDVARELDDREIGAADDRGRRLEGKCVGRGTEAGAGRADCHHPGFVGPICQRPGGQRRRKVHPDFPVSLRRRLAEARGREWLRGPLQEDLEVVSRDHRLAGGRDRRMVGGRIELDDFRIDDCRGLAECGGDCQHTGGHDEADAKEGLHHTISIRGRHIASMVFSAWQ